ERLFAAAEVNGLVDEDGAASVHATIESGGKAGRVQARQAPDHGGDRGDNNQDGRVDDQDGDDDDLAVTAAAGLEMCGIDWLWPGRFARGKFGLIAGLPDYGKGQIAAFIAAAVTAAVELPCDEGGARQGNVLWFNAEDGARDTVLPRLSRLVPTPSASTSSTAPAWAVKTRCLASSQICTYCASGSSGSAMSCSSSLIQ